MNGWNEQDRLMIRRVVFGILQRQRQGPLNDAQLADYISASVEGNLMQSAHDHA